MGQLSFLQLSAGNVPSFCKRSQSHGRRLKMFTGLGLHTWLLQRQRPLFLTQGWVIIFLVFTEFFLLTGKRTAWQLVFAAWHFGIWFFFTGKKLYLENGFKPIVHTGFMWLAASGDCGREYSCRACCKALSVCFWSYPAQARTGERALWTLRTVTGFPNERPNKNKSGIGCGPMALLYLFS